MPFWSENFGEDPTLKDPKRKFRFMVEFQGIRSSQGGAQLWFAKTAAKPSFAISSTEHKYLNHTFYYPGSVTWNEVAITLVDPVNPDMSATLSDIVRLSGYAPPTDATDMNSISKAKAVGAMGTVIVTQIDADGRELEKWTLWNAFISELKYGDLEYGAEDLTELSVTLKYDWARLQVYNTEGSATTAGQGQTTFFNP